MTENTVPRDAKFDDLRVGMTIERVCTHPSGTTVASVGVVGKITGRFANSCEGVWLTGAMDDSDPRVTLRILADPAPKPLPDWGVMVRAVGGKHDGKRAFVTRDEQLHFTRWVVEGNVVPVGWGEITDWEVIHDPNAPKADATDWQKWVDEAKRSECGVEVGGVYIQTAERYWAGQSAPTADPLDEDDHRDRIDRDDLRAEGAVKALRKVESKK